MSEIEPVALLTVALLAAATYVTKVAGFWALGHVDLPERAEVALEALPGGVIVAILAPRLWEGGPSAWLGGAVVVAVAAKTENVILSLLAGLLVVLTLRGPLPGLAV